MGDKSLLCDINDVVALCAMCRSRVPCEGRALCDICTGPARRQVLCLQTEQFARPNNQHLLDIDCDGHLEEPGLCLLITIAHTFFGGVELAPRLKAVVEANMLRVWSLASSPVGFLMVCADLFGVCIRMYYQDNVAIGFRIFAPTTTSDAHPTLSISSCGAHFRPFTGSCRRDNDERRQILARLEERLTQVVVPTMPVPVVVVPAQLPPAQLPPTVQLPPPPPPSPPPPPPPVQVQRITRANLDPPLSICAMFRSSNGVVLICRLSHNVCRTASNIRLQINNPTPLDVENSRVAGNLVQLDTIGTFIEFELDRCFAGAATISASVSIDNTIIDTCLWSHANAEMFGVPRPTWSCANRLCDWARYKRVFANNYSAGNVNDELVEDRIYWFTRAVGDKPCALIRAAPGFFAKDNEWMNTADNSEHVICVWRHPTRSEFAYRFGCSRTRTNERKLEGLSAELRRLNMVNPVNRNDN